MSSKVHSIEVLPCNLASTFRKLPQQTSIVVDLDQPAFYRFPVIGSKRSLIVYVALEGTKNPSGELSIVR
jgi:hypothetical protein